MAMRRNVVNRSGGGPKNRVYDDDEHQVIESPDQNQEEDEAMDKETRLTLMEEVLLLGLKDREVCPRYHNNAKTENESKIAFAQLLLFLALGIRLAAFTYRNFTIFDYLGPFR